MRIVLSLAALLSTFTLMAQDNGLAKVPKQISLEGGYLLTARSELSNPVSGGYSFLFDYAWQLSGFTGRNAGFISVPLGYSQVFPASDTARSVRMINYGWTVRHELRPQKGLVPYFGYGLLLNQYSEKGIDGRRFGHQTRFSVGLNFYGSSPVQPYFQVDYSMTNYPQWGTRGSLGYDFMEFKIGVRFLRGRVEPGGKS